MSKWTKPDVPNLTRAMIRSVVACPKCGAPAGAACLNARRRRGENHFERMQAAQAINSERRRALRQPR